MTDWESPVLDELRASGGKPLKLRDLAARLGVEAEADRESLKDAVQHMVQAGALVRVPGNRFALPSAVGMAVGRLAGHRDGYGFVTPAEPGEGDVYVDERSRHGAMDGDRVVVRVQGRGRFGRLRGEVVEILERAHGRVVGTYRVRKGRGFVIPEKATLYHHIQIASDATSGAADGQRVVCELTKYPEDFADPEGKIVEVLGFAGEADVETRVLLRMYEIPDVFRDAALAEAGAAPQTVRPNEIEGRLDLRELPMVTIDGADAKDLDDAVSLEILDDGSVRLGVHIADVSHYVRPGTGLDEDAYERGTSVYLEDMVVPMLPHQLSNNICSLNAGVDRLAMSCLMRLDAHGAVREYEIRPSVIHSQHRMTYDAVYEVLTRPASPLREQYGDWTWRLEAMDRLAQRLRAIRERRGSLMFDFPEASAEIDEQGAVCDIVLRETNRAHQLIEEFMLIANETVARHMRELGAPFVYRVHERPEEDAIERFLAFVQSLGFRVTGKAPVQPRDLQAIGKLVHGKPEEHLVNTLMLRSLKQARYDAANLGHFGLASQCYCHFTSPIRRYPDLMVHRLLYMVAGSGVEPARKRWGGRLAEIADHCSVRERVAMQAERESLRIKQLHYMAERVGDEFEARITGVQRFGLFVETVRELADGLVHVSTLDDDYYELNEEAHCLEGVRTGRRLRLGDPVWVQVVRVDLDQRELDFRLSRQPEPSSGRRAPEPPERAARRRTTVGRAKGAQRSQERRRNKRRKR